MSDKLSNRFKAACVQVSAGRDIEPNVSVARDLIFRARDEGADFIATPECVTLIEPDNELLRAKVPPEADHPGIEVFTGAAKETGAWILIGSLAVKLGNGKIANRSYLIDGGGGIRATYDKIHMFDVQPGDGETYRESATYEPGAQAVTADTPWARVGMTICYDVRFAYLYRDLAHAGAEVLTVPSAFTKITGEAHWHVLQRARAIETACFVIAPAQCGTHAEGRRTFGHSLIVDPWGEVLADGGDDVGVVTADIDLARVAEARSKVPALAHDRDYTVRPPAGPAVRLAGE